MDRPFICFGVDRQGVCASGQANLFQDDMFAFKEKKEDFVFFTFILFIFILFKIYLPFPPTFILKLITSPSQITLTLVSPSSQTLLHLSSLVAAPFLFSILSLYTLSNSLFPLSLPCPLGPLHRRTATRHHHSRRPLPFSLLVFVRISRWS